jgi:hypothetical protein
MIDSTEGLWIQSPLSSTDEAGGLRGAGQFPSCESLETWDRFLTATCQGDGLAVGPKKHNVRKLQGPEIEAHTGLKLCVFWTFSLTLTVWVRISVKVKFGAASSAVWRDGRSMGPIMATGSGNRKETGRCAKEGVMASQQFDGTWVP